MNLHLSAGATLRFITDPARYLPVVLTRWEGVELMNYSPLVYAFGEKNVAVTGERDARRAGGRNALVAVEGGDGTREPEARPRSPLSAGRRRRSP